MIDGIPELIWYLYTIFILLALFLAFLRFIIGPTISDRILSMDAMKNIITVLLVLLSLFYGRKIYLDVAFVFAVSGFIILFAIVRYIEGEL